MTYMLLQLDDLSTLDVCVVLDQESAYVNFLVPPLVSLHAVMVLIMNKKKGNDHDAGERRTYAPI